MSTLTKQLLTEIASAPELVQQEVLDFVLFVKSRRADEADGGETASRINRTPGVCGGDACIGDTRIAVWMLEEARRLGVSNAELLEDYPSLTPADLAAAWEHVRRHPSEVERVIRENSEA